MRNPTASTDVYEESGEMTKGTIVDLGEFVGRAVSAAKLGDLDLLEVELRRLRELDLQNVASFSTGLRALARSVRAHPSYREITHAQAV
jgi:hypothetical protein